jgi:hypothetical protein
MPSGFEASTVWLILVSMALGRVPRPARGSSYIVAIDSSKQQVFEVSVGPV